MYMKLINPNVKVLFEWLHEHGVESDLVVYTRRSCLLRYVSRLRRQPVRVTWDATWHHSPDQIAIPSNIKHADQAMLACGSDEPLVPAELRDLRMGMERLLAARDALARTLALPEMPEVVLTCVAKNVSETAIKMGFAPENAFLWDDNAELAGQPNVFIVDK
jgi:hypothetical protein